MLTIWGEKLNPQKVLQEYPRPQLRRDSYLNLNGLWEFSMEPKTSAPLYAEQILVPFSPESELSGIHRKKKAGEHLYYRRTFTLPRGFFKGRLLLHFGGVDYACKVQINGAEAGRHEGGYWPFTLDITAFYKEGENVVTLEAEDEGPSEQKGAYGKQSETPGGIWYTAQSGIWQTVWLESVPRTYITGLTVTPQADKEEVLLRTPTGRFPAVWNWRAWCTPLPPRPPSICPWSRCVCGAPIPPTSMTLPSAQGKTGWKVTLHCGALPWRRTKRGF